MKTVLIMPPQWVPAVTQLAVPLLLGQLKAAGFDASGLDLNVEFFNTVLNKQYILKVINELDSMCVELEYKVNNIGIDKTSKEFELLSDKFSAIKTYKEKNHKYFSLVPELIEKSVATLKSDDFYDPKKFLDAKLIIFKTLEIISLPFYPIKISFYDYENPTSNFNYDELTFFVDDKNTNIFIDFYESQINKFYNEDIKCIGISITGSSQVLPGLTLAKMLKQRTSAKIVLGGNYLSRLRDTFSSKQDFFDLFCDILIFEEGEKSVVEIAQYIDGQIPIEKVSSIMYKNGDGEVIVNSKTTATKLDDIANISLDGFDLSKYYIPSIVFPLQASKGCYWNKCAFCCDDYGKTFGVKNVDLLIQHIKEISENYGITHFEFVDEALSPNYFEKFAQVITNEKLDIDYYSCARHETAFNMKLLKKLKKSGLRMIEWGYEAGSERVLNLINKGVEFDKRIKIMKDAADVGLWNCIFFFFGFPTETVKEAQQTIKEVDDNFNVIHSSGFGKFKLVSDKILDNAEKYTVRNIRKKCELSLEYDYEAEGMTKEELDQVLKSQYDIHNENLRAYFYKHLQFHEYMFLYVIRYGSKWLKHHKFAGKKENKANNFFKKLIAACN